MILNTIWEQQYNPMGNIWLSAGVAALPIVIFLISLVVFKLKGYIAGGLSIISAAIVAAVCYKMPVDKIAGAAEQGIVSGLWPVASIVLAAIFLYKLTVKMGFFDVMKQSISSISPDKRIQVLLIAFSFNAFLEGAAGFGAPVAITAAILVGLGFKPLQSAAICLVANIAGGAYGAMGIPVTVPATLTDLDALTLGKNTSLILCLVTVIITFLIVFMVDGFKGIKETFPAILVSGGGFAITQFIFLNFVGPELVNVSSAIVSLLALIVFLRFWQPKQQLTAENKEISHDKEVLTGKEIIRAWTPFILLTLFVTLLNTGFFKQLIQAANPKTGQAAGALNSLIFNFPYYIDGTVSRVAPIVKQPTPIKAVFSFAPFTSTTTAILLAGILTIIIFRVNSRIVISTIRETAKELWGPILTICSVLAFAYISTYSGMSSTLGLAFANTGKIFPLFSPILGWIGVFLTGSVVNSGSLFAGLQSVTASQIGIDPSLLVAANIMGGAIAKMISPQSIAVAAAAVGLVNKDSEIFSKTIKWSVILLVLVGVLNLLITLK
ncbi:lactate permease LctP family transporter [uncultured Gemella sp.]|uniref:L-lactate permease n=1 Tax=uncultured Gemella sp. TaxID=254352 RepID=UPI00260383D9|nr:lactate permease LctP family transporter [uncultured Gemella sp.]